MTSEALIPSDAHGDPALRAYLERRTKENVIGL